MNDYRRILVPVLGARAHDGLYRRAAALADAAAEVRVALILDTASGIEPDGPAGQAHAERAARRMPEARRRLEIDLARGPLAGATAEVLAGTPEIALAELIDAWRPDLIVASAGFPPRSWVERSIRRAAGAPPDLLKVENDSLWSQLHEFCQPRTLGQA